MLVNALQHGALLSFSYSNKIFAKAIFNCKLFNPGASVLELAYLITEFFLGSMSPNRAR